MIEQKLRNCIALQAADPDTHILVYTDGCSDKTAEIAQRFHERIRLVEGRERRGTSFGMNQLARAARIPRRWDILFFTRCQCHTRRRCTRTAMRLEFVDHPSAV